MSWSKKYLPEVISSMAAISTSSSSTSSPARIALVGTGWWGQGWHLPHLEANPHATIAAIVDTSPNRE